MASPFGRAGRLTDTGEPEAEAWHIGRGPATKSPLWRVGCWLIGLAAANWIVTSGCNSMQLCDKPV